MKWNQSKWLVKKSILEIDLMILCHYDPETLRTGQNMPFVLFSGVLCKTNNA